VLSDSLKNYDKFLLNTENTFNYILLIIFLITKNIIRQSVRKTQSLNINQTLIESSETKYRLSEQWLNWLTGLIEADGSFPNEKDNTLSFYISQSTKNTPLIYAIIFWFNFSKVQWQHS